MDTKRIREVFENGEGILHLTPTWVPRTFNEPGHRLRLHPDDYYAFGLKRGGICERWLNSITMPMNGEETGETEGLSFVVADMETKELILLVDFVDTLKEELIGEELIEKYGTWPTFAKLYDYNKPLFHHLHLTEEKANEIGRHGKPEAYYFTRQYNKEHLGRLPLTYFGFDPCTTKEQVKECIANYDNYDTRITNLSRAYRIELGTGWYTAPGVIHAPASIVTYEPQWNSDVTTNFENVSMNEVFDKSLMTDCLPEDERESTEAIFATLDWEENTRSDYRKKYFRPPVFRENQQEGSCEKWVAYGNEWIAAKEITVEPGKKVVIKDSACYGALVVQGHGTIGKFQCEAPEMIRFGQITGDEFFISEKAAKAGVVIENKGVYEPLVILQNFANNNKEVPKAVY